MRILVSSHAFAPSVGGIETVTRLLAREFVGLGHEVKVVTQTESNGTAADDLGFEVIRAPSIRRLVELLAWGDIYWQNNLSLRTLWPAAWLRKPVVITHQGSYCRRPKGIDLVQRAKHAVVERTTSVAVSRAVAACFQTQSTILPNPYDPEVFHTSFSGRELEKELVFLGRLVSEKGVDLLLQALEWLRRQDVTPRLTIVGTGPERPALERLSGKLELSEQVTFVGAKEGEELAELLRTHQVLVVPSRYDEPFGVVALEGIACGCVVIGSSGGGLPEAIGPCGLTFPNGEVEPLARALEKLLREPEEQARFRAQARQHLARFHPEVIARQYLSLFQSLL
jgi:glycogen(starch) synthase